MAYDIHWNIDEMFTYPQQGDRSNVVFGIAYNAWIGPEDEPLAAMPAQVPLPEPGDDFTDYDSLTKDQVVGWVKDALGAHQLQMIEEQLRQAVAAQEEAPKVVSAPLPWE